MLKEKLPSLVSGKRRPWYKNTRDYSDTEFIKMEYADLGDEENELEHFELIKELLIMWARKHDLLNW